MNNSVINVALIGNPNSGKSSLFNCLTGFNQKIANYPGVTVEKKMGFFNCSGVRVNLLDLPGTYGIYPRSEDEAVVTKILWNNNSEDYPDVLLFVASAINIERNIVFISQLRDLGFKIIVAINMNDLLEQENKKIDYKKLNYLLDIKILKINARNGDGVVELRNEIINLKEIKIEKPFINIIKINPILIKNLNLENENPELIYKKIYSIILFDKISAFYQIEDSYLKLKENHLSELNKLISSDIRKRHKEAEKLKNMVVSTEIIHKKVKNTLNKLDLILTHRYFGLTFFLFILYLIFQGIFTIAEYPMNWIDYLFSYTSNNLEKVLPDNIFFDMITKGLIPGIGGILIFIPQIAILYFFINIMEDTGYMSRVVFLTDRIMYFFGLNGRSVIPLISGAACAVPAIMATRSISNWKERLITIFIVPLMTCSARLPVYTILIALAIPNKFVFGFINLQGLVLFGLYMFGLIMGLIIAFVMKMIVKNREESMLIMEMPNFKQPRFKNILIEMYQKVKIFVFDAGKVILIISLILWFLASFNSKGYLFSKEEIMVNTELKSDSEKLEESFMGQMGKYIEPAIKPLGYDWKIGISLISSFAAREIFVGSLLTIYKIGVDEETTIIENLKNQKKLNSNEKVFTPATAISLIIFYALAMQCMSTMSVVRRETNGWKIPILQFIIFGILAYLFAWAGFNLFS